MARIQDRLTQVTDKEVFVALDGAWSRLFGGEQAHPTSLLVLLAQWALETGRGRSMHCYNLGNIKSDQQGGDWCFFRCNEIIDGKVVWFEPDAPACCFRAFTTLEEGAFDYLQTLHQRFFSAWSAVVAGNPTAFSHLLKVNRYYTADEGQYTKTLVSLFSEFSRTIAAPAAKGMPDLYTVAGLQRALAAVGFDPGAADGIDGPHTRAAVEKFQAAHGLVADGVVGRLTRSKLASAWVDHQATLATEQR